MKVLEFLKTLNREESGQDLVEYALVLVAVAGAAVVGSKSLATTISAGITTLNATLQTDFAG
jgi:Flp pilus assembly pilin Flp